MIDTIPDWMKELSEEDWQFIKRLLLASGSLKDVARQYEEYFYRHSYISNRSINNGYSGSDRAQYYCGMAAFFMGNTKRSCNNFTKRIGQGETHAEY